MKTVLVLGAGATLAEASRTGSGRRRAQPPLDRGFFTDVRDAKINPELLEQIRAYVREQHGIDCFHRSWNSVEAVLARIVADCEMLSEADPPDVPAFDAFRALLRLYANSLHRTTGAITVSRESYVYSALFRWLDEGTAPSDISVVTFNHDLVIERTLEKFDEVANHKIRFGALLALPFSYGSAVSELRRFGPGNVPRFPTLNAQPPSFVRILKLHGSLNWRSIHQSAAPGYFELRSGRTDLRWTNRRALPEPLSGPAASTTFPLVIPPVQNKASAMPTIFRGLWDEARDALHAAERVVVFGYSCPPADTEAESLFRLGFMNGASLRELDIVNPDVSIVARFADFAHGRSLRFFEDASTWLESLRSMPPDRPQAPEPAGEATDPAAVGAGA